MNQPPPPFLAGAALLFWGWQSGWILPALVMAAAVEAPRWIPARWEVAESDFRRVWDLCAFLFLGGLVYALASNDSLSAMREAVRSSSFTNQRSAMLKSAQSALDLFRWTPALFFLIVLAQSYSQTTRVPLTVFSGILRRRQWRTRPEDWRPNPGLDTRHPYFAICLASAAITQRPGPGFFCGLALLLGWALWARRSKRYPAWVWGLMLAAAAGTGFAGQAGLYRLQRAVDYFNAVNFFLRFQGTGYDPREIRTALGQIGRLKLSNRILLWVSPKEGPPPALLREASYRAYSASVWRNTAAGRDEFGVMQEEPEGASWILQPPKTTEAVVGVACFLQGGHGLLPVPQGVVRLDNLPVFTLKTNRLGAILADSGPGVVSYQARWGPGRSIDSPPSESADLDVPESEALAVELVCAELNLNNLAPRDALRTLKTHFEDRFQYSTLLSGLRRDQSGRTPLDQFLLRTRTGHCEFFATAATLLLRQAGIPARYAVGYAVTERQGNEYVVRERHSHAWCLAWIDGVWREFDPTPGVWIGEDAAQTPWWQSLSDTTRRLWFGFSKWRWGQTNLRGYIGWFFVPILALLLFEIIRRRAWRRAASSSRSIAIRGPFPGQDSEFYPLCRRLAALGLGPAPGEPAGAWAGRLETAPLPQGVAAALPPILGLHYRYRFDPAGLSAPDRARLAAQSAACLAKLAQSPPAAAARG